MIAMIFLEAAFADKRFKTVFELPELTLLSRGRGQTPAALKAQTLNGC